MITSHVEKCPYDQCSWEWSSNLFRQESLEVLMGSQCSQVSLMDCSSALVWKWHLRLPNCRDQVLTHLLWLVPRQIGFWSIVEMLVLKWTCQIITFLSNQIQNQDNLMQLKDFCFISQSLLRCSMYLLMDLDNFKSIYLLQGTTTSNNIFCSVKRKFKSFKETVRVISDTWGNIK